jgi:hypothetical protein
VQPAGGCGGVRLEGGDVGRPTASAAFRVAPKSKAVRSFPKNLESGAVVGGAGVERDRVMDFVELFVAVAAWVAVSVPVSLLLGALMAPGSKTPQYARIPVDLTFDPAA